jgi:hypothetical protein
MKNHTFSWSCGMLLSVLICAAPVQAQESPVAGPPDFSFGMVGLAPGQTARLNVVNVGPSPSAIPCRLVLAFLDENGKTLGQTFVQVESGKSAFLDLTSSERSRIQVRGIGFNPFLSPISLSCALIPTLEVLSPDTGATSVILTGWVRLSAAGVRTGGVQP